MLTLEKAVARARTCGHYFDRCMEYRDGYWFYRKGHCEIGGSEDFVILKDTGRVISYVQFIWDYKPIGDGEEHRIVYELF